MATVVEAKEFSLKAPSVDLVANTFEGYSAGIGNEDEVGDIIVNGAFDKSIKERVKAGRVKWIDQHNYRSTNELWGTVADAREMPVGETQNEVAKEEGCTDLLWSRFKGSSVQPARDALIKISEGILDGLSIGFKAIRVEYTAEDESDQDDPLWAWLMGRGKRKLLEIAWWETSSVIWGANQAALVVDNSVKELRRVADMVLKQQLPVDRAQLRDTMETLGRLLREADAKQDSFGAVPNGTMLDEMVHRFPQALCKMQTAGPSEDADKLVMVFDGFKQRYKDIKAAGAAFVSLARSVVEGKEVPDDLPAEDAPAPAATDTSASGAEAAPAAGAGEPALTGEPAEQGAGAAAASEGDTGEPAAASGTTEEHATGTAETTDHAADSGAGDGSSQADDPSASAAEDAEILSLQLASLELMELELAI